MQGPSTRCVVVPGHVCDLVLKGLASLEMASNHYDHLDWPMQFEMSKRFSAFLVPNPGDEFDTTESLSGRMRLSRQMSVLKSHTTGNTNRQGCVRSRWANVSEHVRNMLYLSCRRSRFLPSCRAAASRVKHSAWSVVGLSKRRRRVASVSIIRINRLPTNRPEPVNASCHVCTTGDLASA